MECNDVRIQVLRQPGVIEEPTFLDTMVSHPSLVLCYEILKVLISREFDRYLNSLMNKVEFKLRLYMNTFCRIYNCK